MKIRNVLSAMAIMLLVGVSAAFGSVAAVNFGADYASANINASGALVVSRAVADFDGSSDDRVGSIAFGTEFSPPNSVNWNTPAGKSGGVIKYGTSVANINSATDPSLGVNRISTADIIQAGNGAGTTAMRLASAWYWEKASFLNGASAASGLAFTNAASSLSAYFNNGGTPTTGFSRRGNFLVENGSTWYISADEFGSTGGSFAINAATAQWYVFDPAAGTLFWDRAAMGTAVSGSTFTNIQAMGLYVQHELINGTTINAALQGFSSFQATVIPEPATIGMLGLGAAAMLLVRRLRG